MKPWRGNIGQVSSTRPALLAPEHHLPTLNAFPHPATPASGPQAAGGSRPRPGRRPAGRCCGGAARNPPVDERHGRALQLPVGSLIGGGSGACAAFPWAGRKRLLTSVAGGLTGRVAWKMTTQVTCTDVTKSGPLLTAFKMVVGGVHGCHDVQMWRTPSEEAEACSASSCGGASGVTCV